jgi:hypothetical protein
MMLRARTVIASVMLGLLSLNSAVYAAPAPASAPTSGQGLEISPPVIELSADPGQTVTSSIRIRNVTRGELIAKGTADDFGAGASEDGQPKLLLDETGSTRYSLKFWIQGVPDLSLAPSEIKIATVKIIVPKNAEPGGHFGVVRFTAAPPGLQGTGVALSASIGALILLKVSGNITEKASLSEFSTSQITTPKGKPPVTTKTSFFEHGPINFLVRIKNEGSVHEKVVGSITVKDWLGKQVGTVKVNELGGNILPDSIRRFEQSFAQKQLFGHYTATLAMSYSGNKVVGGTVSFWVIPWKLILLVVIGLILLFFILRTGLRRYNASVIARARRR